MYPQIVYEEEAFVYNIRVEDVLIASTDDIFQAFTTWFSSFYIFNLEFPPKRRLFLCYMQRALLCLKDNKKLPAAVYKLMKDVEEGVKKVNTLD